MDQTIFSSLKRRYSLRHALALFVGQLRADAGAPDAPALLEKIERSVEALEELLEALLIFPSSMWAPSPRSRKRSRSIRFYRVS